MARTPRTESTKAFRQRMIRETAASVQRAALQQIADRIVELKRRRKRALLRARELCRASRLRSRQAIRAFRAAEREKLNARVREMRASVSAGCAARRDAIARTAKTEQTRLKRLAAEQRRREREFRRLDKRILHERGAAEKRIERRRREEDDDQVEANIAPELVPVWRAWAKQIKPSPRATRTEQFLEQVSENPDEVLQIQIEQAGADVEQLVSARDVEELEELERRLARRKPAKATLSDAELAQLRGHGIDPFASAGVPF